MTVSHVELADGRRLRVVEDGDPDGVVVIVHHGTPSSAVMHPPWGRDAAERGLRLVTYARPGYATSTRRAGRAVADAAADAAAIADALGADRFLSWGISGGGPHALACAALLPERVVAAASLAAIAPYGAPGLDYMDGMGQGNIDEFGLVIEGGEEGSRPFTEAQARELIGATLQEMVAAMAPYLSASDEEQLRGPLGETMLAQFRDGLGGGADGWVDDNLAFVSPWGFDLSAIAVPVLLWQGRHDDMVPFGHGAWLAGQIRGVDARLSEHDGHLTLITHRIPEVHQWLRDRWDAAAG